MDNARSFLLTLFAWSLFAMAGAWFLTSEQRFQTLTQDYSRPTLFGGPYTGTADLTRLSGEQVLGMVPYALKGEYTLAIEGVGTIDSSTDLTSLNLRWIPDREYQITAMRDADGNIESITAKQ